MRRAAAADRRRAAGRDRTTPAARSTTSTSRSKQRCSTTLVPLYVEIQIYRALLESIASEFGARMTAMDTATNNAEEMIAR